MKSEPAARRYRATYLEAILEAQGRRRDWVAAVGGISPSLVSHLLSGERTVDTVIAERIAGSLGVPVFLAFAPLDCGVPDAPHAAHLPRPTLAKEVA